MKISSLYLLLSVFIFSCSLNNEAEPTAPSESPYSIVPTDSVVIYGNYHFVPPELMDKYGIDQNWRNLIIATQQWLYYTVSEHIVLVEGWPFDSQITEKYYVDFYKSETGKDIRSGQLDSLKKFAWCNEVQTAFILDGEKKVFGSEDYAVYRKFKNEYFADSALDKRSEAMAKNIFKTYKRFNRKIALVVGDNHLAWFEDRGFKVVHPPDSLHEYLKIK